MLSDAGRHRDASARNSSFLSWHRPRDPDPPASNRHDGPAQKILCVIPQDVVHERDATFDRDVRQSHEPSMRCSVAVDELAEVLVHRHEDTCLGRRPGEQDPVTGILPALKRFGHVMPLLTQPLGQPPTGAPVDQKPHEAPTRTASSESWAITACA